MDCDVDVIGNLSVCSMCEYIGAVFPLKYNTTVD